MLAVSFQFLVLSGIGYIGIYTIQVGFQVRFQVEQDADHLESDLSSPVLSFA